MKHTNAILVCLLAVGLLAACGKKKAEEAAAAPGSPAATTPAAPGDPIVVQDTGSGEPEAIPTVAVDEAMPPMDEGAAAPKVIAQGQFKQAGSEVAVSGEATLYDDGFGTRLLRIENLKSPHGFSMEVGFTTAEAPTDAKSLKGRVIIGTLKGASGNMNYLIGREIDLTGMRSLVLYEPGTPPLLTASIAGMLPAKH
jgi:hypothetical protein